jgi:phosphoribosylglycinamide formyltransferase-1
MPRPGFAREQGIATAVLDHKDFDSREAFDAALAQQIDSHEPALVVLAGFMRILTPGFVNHFAGRLLNIHPSLLPAFPGLHTHQRAIDAGCKFAGATVHQVTAELDVGPILDQAVVPVLPEDTPDPGRAGADAGTHHLPACRGALSAPSVTAVVGRLSGWSPLPSTTLCP